MSMFKWFKRKPQQAFVVNSAQGSQQFRVNVSTSVAAADIREEVHNGRVMLVLPSKTLPSGIVMNDMMYPEEEIAKGFMSLEGTPAPLGHPIVNGEYVSAKHPEAYLHNVGAFNKNVRRENGSVAIDKFIDKAYAEKVAPELMEAINAGQPISTSTGLLCDREPVTGKPYKWVARNLRFDHDAILLNEAPAAGVGQGVGMLVNQEFVINSVLTDSERDTREMLSQALPDNAYLIDYDDTTVIYEAEQGEQAADYSITDGVVKLDGSTYNVTRKTTWERVKAAFTPQTSVQVDTMNEEEKALLIANAKASAEALVAMTETMTKLGEQVTAIQAEQAKVGELAVNAQLSDKRAIVAAKLGEVVANALSGDALDEAVAKCQTAEGVTGGFATNAQEDALTYEKE